MRRLKLLLIMAVGLLPASRAKNHLLTTFGYRIHPTAKIGPIVLLKVGRMEVGAGTEIQFGNLFRKLRSIRVGSECTVMRSNRFWALAVFGHSGAADPVTVGVLSLGDHVLITEGHAFDCSGGISMADWSAIAGRETLIYSHSYDPSTHTLCCAPTMIGENSFIAARTTLAMGATLPARSLLSTGAVLMPGADTTDTVYGGVPAKPIGDFGDEKRAGS